MKKLIKRILYGYRFEIGIFGLMFNPVYFANKYEINTIKKYNKYIKGEVLDVGCGKKPHEDLFLLASKYVGLDTNNSGHNHKNEDIDILYNGKKFPFEDETFDSIVSFQVLEHVEDETLFLQEIKRVLKRNGTLMLTIPFMWEEHEVPYDFRRYTSYGLKKLFEDMGFEILKHEKLGAKNSFFLQQINTYLRKFRVKKFVFLSIPLISISNMLGELCDYLPTINKSIYGGHLIILNKKD